jgi:phage FluMu protein Com
MVRGKFQPKESVSSPNEGLTPEEIAMIAESQSRTKEVIEKKPLDLKDINVDLNPVSFGDKYDSLPIIKVNSILPSGGYNYPEGYSISYRPLVFSELNKISSYDIGFDDMVKIILSGIHTSFNKEDLTFFDFTFLALLRKIATLGDSKVKVVIRCPKCDQKNTFTINVSSDEKTTSIRFWDVKYDDLPIKAQLSFGEEEGKWYEFNPLTIKQYLVLSSLGLNKDRSAVLAAQSNENFEEMYKKIEFSYGDDDLILREIDDLLTHGIKPIPGKCDNCNTVSLIKIDDSKVILRPFRKPKDITKDRIRFGSKG